MRKVLILLLVVVMLFTSACSSDKADIGKNVEGTTDNIDNKKVSDKSDKADKSNAKKTIAPTFELVDLDGNTVKLGDFVGKKVFLNFWATWCDFCVQEMPDMMKLQEAHKDDLVILFINVGESKDKVQKFVDEHKLSGIILLDEKQDVANLYGVDGFPTTFAINDKGEAITYFKGVMSYELMEQMYDLTE